VETICGPQYELIASRRRKSGIYQLVWHEQTKSYYLVRHHHGQQVNFDWCAANESDALTSFQGWLANAEPTE
jgi:hypothetical protein